MKHTILFGLIFTCISRSFISAANAPDCKPISECELCEEGPQRQSGTKGCEETGKHRKWSCPKHDDDEEEQGDNYIEFRSCKRTTIEEEYNVIRFEALCLLISLFSLRTVRREKLLNESLFDKLKRQAKIQQQQQQPQQQQQQGKTLTREQEMTPLVSSTSNVIDNVPLCHTEGMTDEQCDLWNSFAS